MRRLFFCVLFVLALAGCSVEPAPFCDGCSVEQVEQIEDAIETWQALCPDRVIDPRIVIDCEKTREKSALAMGRTVRYFDETVIYLCFDWPEEQRADLARIVALHELGHFLGAEHTDDLSSVMRTGVSSWDMAGEPSLEDVSQAGCAP